MLYTAPKTELTNTQIKNLQRLQRTTRWITNRRQDLPESTSWEPAYLGWHSSCLQQFAELSGYKDAVQMNKSNNYSSHFDYKYQTHLTKH